MKTKGVDKVALIDDLRSAYPSKDEEANAFIMGMYIALTHAHGRGFAEEITQAVEGSYMERFVL